MIAVVVVAVLEEPRGGIAVSTVSAPKSRGSRGHTAPDLRGVLELAVVRAEHPCAREPEDPRGCLGLGTLVRASSARSRRRVARAPVAVREDQQVDLASGRGPLRHRPPAEISASSGCAKTARTGPVGRGDAPRPRPTSRRALRASSTYRTSARTGDARGALGPSDRRPCRRTPAPRCRDAPRACRRRTRARNNAAVIAPAYRSADVLDVGDVRVDQLAVALEHRELPPGLAGGLAGREHVTDHADDRCPSRPAGRSPSATMHAPVSVAVSRMTCGFFSAR